MKTILIPEETESLRQQTADCHRFVIIGIDLAWGEISPDGICVIQGHEGGYKVTDSSLSHGDQALVDFVARHDPGTPALQVAVDAPIVCRNVSGARPVDRETHRCFGKNLCGCYPANLRLCPRPSRVAAQLAGLGLAVGWESPRSVFEVYPHPAVVRWAGLSERIPYKKGRVEVRRREFQRLQSVLQNILRVHFPGLQRDPVCKALLSLPWSKAVEDRTDALICALMGLWHWEYRGKRTECLGDNSTGFLLVPRP